MGMSLSRASALVGALDSTAWDLFEAVGRLTDDRADVGQRLRARVAEALEADELAVGLASALKSAQADAVRLLASVSEPRVEAPRPETPPPTPDVPHAAGSWRQVRARDRQPAAEAVAELTDYVSGLKPDRKHRVVVSWRVEQNE